MRITLLTASLCLLWGCASTANAPETYVQRYSRIEIAQMASQDLQADATEMATALKPTYKKYGAPQAYIDGLMSSINDPTLSRLYGSGEVAQKLKLSQHIFWAINGEHLTGLLQPIKTVHLVYDVETLDDADSILQSVGGLTRRGQTFQIFERLVDNQIVVTVHKSEDIPKQAALETLVFYQK